MRGRREYLIEGGRKKQGFTGKDDSGGMRETRVGKSVREKGKRREGCRVDEMEEKTGSRGGGGGVEEKVMGPEER